MLLSQLILRNKSSIVSDNQNISTAALLEYRSKILNAVKFIIPNSFFKINLDMPNEAFSDITQWSDFLTEKNYDYKLTKPKNSDLYSEFIKTPFPLMFIENENIGFLLETKGDVVLVTPFGAQVSKNKIVSDGCEYYFKLNSEGMKSEFTDRTMTYLASSTIRKAPPEVRRLPLHDFMSSAYFNAAVETQVTLSIIYHTVLCETLLFMNLKNPPIVKYVFSKVERKYSPKSIPNTYTYNILDIFKANTEYHSLEDVSSFIRNNSHSKVQLVRGHFKRKFGQLFWWNTFVRNRKGNEEVVAKTYRINEE